MLIQKEAKLIEDFERAKQEKRSAENALDEIVQFRNTNDDRNQQITELHHRLGDERRARDLLTEQIRKLHQKNDDLRHEISQRDEWKQSDVKQLESDCDIANLEMDKMRKVLVEAQKENNELSASLIRDQSAHDKQDTLLKQRIGELEEKLVEAGIRHRGANIDNKQSKVIREMQEELATTR